jgi:dihydroxyacetone kinase-like predicted kinase
MQHVKTGQLTFAVRDTSIDGLEIEKGDFMGISEGKIVLKDKDKVSAAKNLLEKMLDEEAEILTILKGEDATQEDVESLKEFLEQNYGDIEIEVHDGGQPLYAFIFAIE